MINKKADDLTAQLLREFLSLSQADQQFLITLMRRLNRGEISGDEFSEALRYNRARAGSWPGCFRFWMIKLPLRQKKGDCDA